jgi:hypothetical protein
MKGSMGQDRAAAAIERVERALSRIEAAAARRPPAPAADNQELSELRDAYRALRGRVEGTVGALDRLLALADG